MTDEADFYPRSYLYQPPLLELYSWDEPTFLHKTEGSPIRRIGYFRWLRNISVALGNAPYQADIISALEKRKGFSPLLDQHIDWAISQQMTKRNNAAIEIQQPKQKRLIRSVEKGLPRDA